MLVSAGSRGKFSLDVSCTTLFSAERLETVILIVICFCKVQLACVLKKHAYSWTCIF